MQSDLSGLFCKETLGYLVCDEETTLDLFCRDDSLFNTVCLLCFRVFGTSMVEEYEEIADSQYLSERLEYLDEDYGKMLIFCVRWVVIAEVYIVHLFTQHWLQPHLNKKMCNKLTKKNPEKGSKDILECLYSLQIHWAN